LSKRFGSAQRVYSAWRDKGVGIFTSGEDGVPRRAERVCVHLSREEPVDAVYIKFVNCLSDALFVLARWAAKTQGEPEFLWERDVKKAAG
jgi:hypothetical protein